MEKQIVKKYNRRNKKMKQKHRYIILRVFTGYFTNTKTLQIIAYIGQNRCLLEKSWWIICFLMSIIACFYSIHQIYMKMQNDPIILSFEKEQTNIWAIPFPAVTVCPINKIRQSLYNYTNMFLMRNNLTTKEYKEFWDLSLVCNLEQHKMDINNIPINYITDEACIEVLREYAPDINYTVGGVRWQNRMENDDIFTEQLTEEGLCFTFNSFGQSDMFTNELNQDIIYINHNVKNQGWSMEGGYQFNTSIFDLPRRSAKDGFAAGLSFSLFSILYDIDYTCSLPITGFKVTLHNPAESPKIAQQYFLLPLYRKVTLIVRPKLITTSENLRSLLASKRKCYFSNEKSLRFFKIYTQNNCQVECNTNLIQQYCGCVPFYLPRDKQTLICGYGKMNCIAEIKNKMEYLNTLNMSSMSREENKQIKHLQKIYENCDCLPSCNSLDYTAETSQAEVHSVKTLLLSGLMDNEIEAEFIEQLNAGVLTETQVDIFFKESQFSAMKRNELYGSSEFLANCGGLLSLFMGFSVLSVCEIIYFFIIHLWLQFKRIKATIYNLNV